MPLIKPIQLYLKWEIDLYLNLLKKPISLFSQNIESYKAAVEMQLPITVNQFRKAAGSNISMHPDKRGEKFVFEPDEPALSDSEIPAQALISAWAQIIKQNETVQQGQLTREELIVQYPELFKRASRAATKDGVELP